LKDHHNQLTELLGKTELTIEEMQWLLIYLENSDDPALKQIMQSRFTNDLGKRARIPKQVSEKLFRTIHEAIDMPPVKQRARLISIRKIAVAASIVGLIITGFFLIGHDSSKQIVKTDTKERRFRNDVAPGGYKATLTLADGSVILLDDANNGTLTQQGDAKVIKLDGKVLYDLVANTKQVVYNTISTPRGGQYQLALPDGSMVWLNATSSVRFPTAFTGNDRRVEITGEAYFEVAKDPARPFIVSVNNAEVQVLGTHFNINAYNDEEEVKTTLLEGSVKFVNGAGNIILRPGQQSQLSKDGIIKLENSVNVEEVIAWKNGRFNFENAGIEMIMRQLSRWYDVEIEYNGKTDDLFIAEMPRDIKLSDALKALELTGRVRFEIDGKKIIVMP
jgi:transmembrane sensor